MVEFEAFPTIEQNPEGICKPAQKKRNEAACGYSDIGGLIATRTVQPIPIYGK